MTASATAGSSTCAAADARALVAFTCDALDPLMLPFNLRFEGGGMKT